MSLYLSINHEDLGLRSFEIKADNSATIDLGGYTTEREITGAGSAIVKRNRKVWQIESVDVFCDIEAGDLEYLQGTLTSRKEAVITYQHDDGFTYSGTGGIAGDVKYNTADKTVSINLSGGGMLTKI